MSCQHYGPRRRHVRASEQDAEQVGRNPSGGDITRNSLRKKNTHGSTDGATRDGKLNALIRFKAVDTARREKIRSVLRATQDLEQHRNGGGYEGFIIDSELEDSKVLILCKTLRVRRRE